MTAMRSTRTEAGSTSAATVHASEAALDQAMLRAYSIERSMDYGCSLEDVLKLRRRVETGEGWASTLSLLAADDRSRAELSKRLGHRNTAGMFRLQAAAAWRLMQAGLEHRPLERLAAYENQCCDFSEAMALQGLGLTTRYLETSFQGAPHGAWVFGSAGLSESSPCVLVWGGADGWREAFFGSVPAFIERGMSVCLMDLPGQGMARLKHQSFLNESFTDYLSTVIDTLSAGQGRHRRFGVAGHSLGGSLALAAAAADDRIDACCTNGGSVDLSLGLQKYPRVLRRFARLLGADLPDEQALDLISRFALPAAASRMRAQLLCLHGSQDVLVSQDEVNRLVDLRGAASTTVEVWPHGVHCLYNHAIERNCVMTDWFASVLGARSTS